MSSKKPDPETGSNPPADPPTSPTIVRKTPIQRPKEAELEKRIKAVESRHSEIENRVDGIDGALKGLNQWLEGLFPGGRKPTKTEPAKGKGFLDDAVEGIFGGD
jgi:hypothetical protein